MTDIYKELKDIEEDEILDEYEKVVEKVYQDEYKESHLNKEDYEDDERPLNDFY